MNGILLRAYSYLLGFPILLVSRDKAIASNVKGELIEPKDDVFEPLLKEHYDNTLR